MGQQLQTGEFCCLFATGPSNRKHELHCSGNKTQRQIQELLKEGVHR